MQAGQREAAVELRACAGDCEMTFPLTREFFRAKDTRRDGTPKYSRLCRWCSSSRYARSRGRATYGGSLPVGPFRDWLLRHAERISRDDPASGGGFEELARRVGFHQREMYRVFHESSSVSLDIVDRALCRVGNETLMDLYPWLYGHKEDEKVATTTGHVGQAMAALELANDVRVRRAELKGELRNAGGLAFDRVAGLFEQDPPPWLEGLKPYDLLRCLPVVGKVKATRMLRECDVSSFVTLGRLSPRQRHALASKVRCSQRGSRAGGVVGVRSAA